MQRHETILDNKGNQIALVIRKNLSPEATTFFSEPSHSQQVGIIKHAKGGRIKPHYHNELARRVVYTQEVLVIRRGSLRVDLYDAQLKFLRVVLLTEGDVIFLISGGHGFEMLEDCEMLEVKQGPYSGVSNDKTQFEGKRN